MSRVGIVTIIDQMNYGNRLQNYALQCALENLGVDTVETIRNAPHAEKKVLRVKRAVIAIARAPRATLARNVALVHERRAGAENSALRHPALSGADRGMAFTNSHIREYPVDFDEIEDKVAFGEQFDAFVVGSDQVWNPGFRNANGIDFLSFAQPRQRIAYAASFGVPEVPAYLRSTYRRALRGIPSISVRERVGATIISDLIKREVPVVLDPTLLVEPERWSDLAEEADQVDRGDYALAFFLGGFREGEEEDLVRECASDGLYLIDFFSADGLRESGPATFLDAVRRAQVVITDSFHAVVMSIALQTPFRVRLRHADDTRMEALNALVVATEGSCKTILNVAIPDWGEVRQRIEAERHESLRWLKQALEYAEVLPA